jgi:hypothetical protein
MLSLSPVEDCQTPEHFYDPQVVQGSLGPEVSLNRLGPVRRPADRLWY